jgi:hypothetical protein
VKLSAFVPSWQEIIKGLLLDAFIFLPLRHEDTKEEGKNIDMKLWLFKSL